MGRVASRQRLFLSPLLQRQGESHELVNLRSGRVLARRVACAFDSRSRRKGLLSRDVFHEGDALVIAPCSAIHTCFMRFAIDVAFAARDGTVVKTYAHVRPWRLAWAMRAYAVIELPAGTFDRVEMARGDVLAFAPAS